MNAGRNGRHKTDNDFLAFPYDSKTRIRVIYEFRQWYKFDGGTVVDECCYATKRRLAVNQGGGDDANVIFQ
jgi:hypothetical protein